VTTRATKKSAKKKKKKRATKKPTGGKINPDEKQGKGSPSKRSWVKIPWESAGQRNQKKFKTETPGWGKANMV